MFLLLVLFCIGGKWTVLLAGDEEARSRGTQKSVLERKAPPTFPLLIEMRERAMWVTHWVEDSVDCLLHGKAPVVQVIARSAYVLGISMHNGRYESGVFPCWNRRHTELES